MVYDTLSHAVIDLDALLHTLLDYQPTDSETIGGYEVYGLDATKDERPEAETLPERCSLKSQKDEPLVYGHKYSSLVRLVAGTSWVAPQDTLRIDPELSDSQVGRQQVKELVGGTPSLSGGGRQPVWNHIFLAIFLRIQNSFALVRMRSNNVLYEQPSLASPARKALPRSMAPGSSSPAQLARRCCRNLSARLTNRPHPGLERAASQEAAQTDRQLLRVEFLSRTANPATNSPCGCFGLDQPASLCKPCAGCICGASPSSTCSGFSNKTWAQQQSLK